jgi:hypothetical protein
MARAVLLAALMLAIACGELFGPQERAARELTAGVVGSDSAPAGATQPTAFALNGRELVARGLLTAPSPCQELRHSGVGQAFTLVFVIDARSRSGGCVDAVTTFAYRLRVRLEPGEYQVSVVHRFPETGWPEVIAGDTLLRVP